MNNIKSIARLTGVGYLGIFVTGFFANFFVLEGLVNWENMNITALNFINNPNQFYQGLAAFCLMIMLDISLSYPLYKLLKNENKKWAMISSCLRLVNGLYFFYALSFLVDLACELHQKPFDLEINIGELLLAFNKHWAIGLIIFGLHLLVLGNLVRKSVKFPSIIGLFLSLAGVGYLLDSSAQLGFFQDEVIKDLFANMVVMAGTLGELSFTIFLLIKGVKKT